MNFHKLKNKYANKPLSIIICFAMLLGLLSSSGYFVADAALGYWPTPLPMSNEFYYQNETLQPYGACFQIDELKNWSPENDPDARYNRSSIALTDRWMGPSVNPLASRDARVYPLAMSNARASESPSQGGNESFVYAFNNFQYVDTYNFWGGSSAEGAISIPTPEHIDSAHRNGVKATGTIFLPWGDSAYGNQFVREMVEKDSEGNYYVADKLIEIAEYYGFDGYMFNTESGSSVAGFKDFLKYMQNKKPDNFEVTWYNGSGSLSESSINSWLQDDTGNINNNWWLDMSGGSASSINSTLNSLKAKSISPFDAFSSWEYFPMASGSKGGSYTTRLDANGLLKISLGILAPTTTLTQSKDTADFLNIQDQLLWVGPEFDPSSTKRRTDIFPGFASLVADRTPIIGSDFVTNFTTGNGYAFYEDGKITGKSGGWYNRSLTDILPTWRWLVHSEGSKLSPSIDLNDAWWGGSSIKFEGNIDAKKANIVRLYSTKLDIKSSSTASMTFKTNKSNIKMSLGLCYDDSYDEENFVYYPMTTTTQGDWTTVKANLGKDAGKTAIAISLKFESNSNVKDFVSNIGQLAIKSGIDIAPTGTSKIIVDEVIFKTDKIAEARVYWEKADNTFTYAIHRVLGNGTREFVAATPSDAFYIGEFGRDGNEAEATFEITSYDKNFIKGESKPFTITWPDQVEDGYGPSPKLGKNLALGKPAVSSVGVAADGPVDKVNDGVIGSSKWCGLSSRGYAVIDLGENTDISRWIIHHANTRGAGEGVAMNTVDFSFQYAVDDGKPLITGDNSEMKTRVRQMTTNNDFNIVESVSANKQNVTDRNIETPISARYLKIDVTKSDSSPWSAIRIYEFEVYGEPGVVPVTAPLAPLDRNVTIKNKLETNADTVIIDNVTMNYATGSYPGGGINPKSGTVNLYDSYSSDTPIATIRATQPKEEYKMLQKGIAVFESLELNPDGGRLYYEVIDDEGANIVASPRRSVYYPPQSGDQVSDAATTTLERSVKGNTLRLDYGRLTLTGLDKGVSLRVYQEEDSTKPVVFSNVSEEDGIISVERVPLNPQGGIIYYELYQNGKASPERISLAYASTDAMAVDKLSLKNMIDTFKRYNQNKYIPSSWGSFETALSDAKLLLAKDTVSGNEAERAYNNLVIGRSNIETAANVDRLEELVNEYSRKLKETDYTSDSWATFSNNLSNVEETVLKVREDGEFINLVQAKKQFTDLLYSASNLYYQYYTITITTTGNGSVTTSNSSALAGTEITLNISPNEGHQLVEGSLKINGKPFNGDKFDMLVESVTITADFELTPPKTNKILLNSIVKNADDLKEAGALDDVMPSVKAEFEAALSEAKDILTDRYSDQTTINASSLRLTQATHKLSFKIANKENLELAIELATIFESDLDRYVDAGKQEFIAALALAGEIFEDGEAFQEDVDDTYNVLMEALLNLRLKAEKENLRKAIKSTNDINRNLYTLNSLKNLDKKLVVANTVYDDETLSFREQKVVDVTTSNLNKAVKDLVLKIEDDKDDPDDSTNKSEKTNTDKKDDLEKVVNKTTSTVPKTGEKVVLSFIMLLSLFSLFLTIITVKKKSRK